MRTITGIVLLIAVLILFVTMLPASEIAISIGAVASPKEIINSVEGTIPPRASALPNAT